MVTNTKLQLKNSYLVCDKVKLPQNLFQIVCSPLLQLQEKYSNEMPKRKKKMQFFLLQKKQENAKMQEYEIK